MLGGRAGWWVGELAGWQVVWLVNCWLASCLVMGLGMDFYNYSSKVRYIIGFLGLGHAGKLVGIIGCGMAGWLVGSRVRISIVV